MGASVRCNICVPEAKEGSRGETEEGEDSKEEEGSEGKEGGGGRLKGWENCREGFVFHNLPLFIVKEKCDFQ